MIKLLSLFLIMLTSSANADFDLIKTGQPSPYDGYLITIDREATLRLNDQKLTFATQLNTEYSTALDLQTKERDILQQRLTVYQDENLRLSKEIVEAKGDGFWNKFAYFALGVGASILTVYGVREATK